MDKVFISGLKADAVIGVFDWEREIRQTLIVDVEMAADIKKASLTENLADALDYNAISIRLVSYIEQSSFQLIETLAEHLSDILREEFSVKWLKLTLSKPGAVKAANNVGVIIERGEV